MLHGDAISLEDTPMAFHITVICADPAVESTIAAALEPSAIAQSSILHAHADLAALIDDISWLRSPADVSPHSDLAIVYHVPNTLVPIDQLLPIFSHTRLLLLTKREGKIRMRFPEGYAGPFLNFLIVPFDHEELYLRIYNMLKTARAG
jgi:hypothetical protein